MNAPIERWCAASLRIALGDEGDALIRRGRPWLEAVVDDVDAPPALGIVLDIGRLLMGERTTWTELQRVGGLDRALQGYAEHLIGRLRQDRLIESATMAVLRLPFERRPHAVALIVDKLLRRLDVTFPMIPRASLRFLLAQPEEDLWTMGDAALDDPEIVAMLSEQFNALSASARRTGMLLRESDVFVLEHLDALQNPSQQLALEHITDAASAIERGLPRRIRARARKVGTQRTKMDEEGTYPTGGYASVANHGSLQNLVPTELAYVEDGEAIDLFDLRFATNELLKYTRDESVFHRQRRTVVLALDETLVAARVKTAQLPWQRAIVVAGALVAIVRRLFEQCVDDDLRVELLIPGALRAEGQLVEMLMHDWLELGTLRVLDSELDREQERLDELAEIEHVSRVQLDAREALVDLDAWIDEAHRVLRELL